MALLADAKARLAAVQGRLADLQADFDGAVAKKVRLACLAQLVVGLQRCAIQFRCSCTHLRATWSPMNQRPLMLGSFSALAASAITRSQNAGWWLWYGLTSVRARGGLQCVATRRLA